ncbi:MAG TPA: ABC transporter substrate-binding protein [Steroidobacteraceae bacterium]|nr:ABC transporter substrate-binding protein [Steroidobacteraceae bacterium]
MPTLPEAILERIRRRSTPLENALLDERAAGRIGRRDFIRHGSVIGLSIPLLSALAGLSPRARAAGIHAGAAGGTIRVGIPVPAASIDPLTVADTGGVCMLSQTGEHLAISMPGVGLIPALAESWKPNADGSVWVFTIRSGVRFHSGQAMTAADVAATIDRLADPANGSVALSAFAGVLSKGGSRALDARTVEFRLDAPNGNFPYLVSSDNFSAIILPAGYEGDFEKNFIGTGAFRLEKLTPMARASFLPNDDYWGGKPLPRRTEFIFYDSIQAMVLAMQGGQLDMLLHVPLQGSQALLNDPNLNVVGLKSSAHQQVHMRTDSGPFADKRVRRAMALCLNRENLVKGMFRGRASLGNDSPFAPVFASTDPTAPQRVQDIAQARKLLGEAGLPNGFAVTLTTERFLEIPDYAVVIQNAAKRIGVDIRLNIEDQAAYYGQARFGQSDWLDSVMGIEDYAHRGVPNTLLSATLGSAGTFNAAHFKSAAYDRWAADYIAALDPASQRQAAGRIQRLLLDETPVIFGYFYDWLSVIKKDLAGVRATAGSQLYLDRAHFN